MQRCVFVSPVYYPDCFPGVILSEAKDLLAVMRCFVILCMLLLSPHTVSFTSHTRNNPLT
jgi:hypothetical protein